MVKQIFMIVNKLHDCLEKTLYQGEAGEADEVLAAAEDCETVVAAGAAVSASSHSSIDVEGSS